MTKMGTSTSTIFWKTLISVSSSSLLIDFKVRNNYCGIGNDSITSMNSEVEREIEDGYEFKVTSYRWVICACFALNFMGRAIANVGFASIAKILQEIYGVDTIQTTLLAIPFNFMVLFFLFPYNYVSIKYGLRIPTYVAVIVLIIGAWTRILVNSSFGFLILGQTIIAIGQPLTLVAPAKIASLWFGDDQRALATMIGSLANPIGAVIGFVMPFAFVSDHDAVDTPDSRHKVRNYIIVQNILIMVLSIPIFFFVKNKPEVAPSISALKSIHARPEGNWSSIKKLVRDRDYMLLLIVFSLLFSVYVCFGAVMGPMMDLFKFKASSNQFFGVAYIIIGVAGSFIHATFLDKHKTYKKQLIIICLSNISSAVIFICTVHLASVPLTTAIVGLFGAAQLPIIGVGYQFATELAYPINENITIGFLQFITCIFGIAYTFFTAYIVNQGLKYFAAVCLGAPGLISIFIAFFIRENLNKHRLSLLYSSSVRSSAVSDLSTEEH